MNNTTSTIHAHIVIIGINYRMDMLNILLQQQSDDKWVLPKYITNDIDALDTNIKQIVKTMTNINDLKISKINEFDKVENELTVNHKVYLCIVPLNTTYTHSNKELWFDISMILDPCYTDYENRPNDIFFSDYNYHDDDMNTQSNMGSITAYTLIHIFHKIANHDNITFLFLPDKFTLSDLHRVVEIITTVNLSMDELKHAYKNSMTAIRSKGKSLCENTIEQLYIAK